MHLLSGQGPVCSSVVPKQTHSSAIPPSHPKARARWSGSPHQRARSAGPGTRSKVLPLDFLNFGCDFRCAQVWFGVCLLQSHWACRILAAWNSVSLFRNGLSSPLYCLRYESRKLLFRSVTLNPKPRYLGAPFSPPIGRKHLRWQFPNSGSFLKPSPTP